MSEMKRPKELEMYGGNGLRRSVYLKYDADAYIAALERRLRVAIRALCIARGYANELQKQLLGIEDETVAECLVEAEREIDSEKGEQSDG